MAPARRRRACRTAATTPPSPSTPLPDLAIVERFYASAGLDPIVAVAPAEERAELDAALAAAGWDGGGPHGRARRHGRRRAGRPPRHSRRGVAAVDPFAWPNEVIREEVLARAAGDVLAFAEGQRGAVICIRTGDLAGIFRLHVAPAARREGVGSRLLAACATAAPFLYAQVETGNDPAQRLFARAGFTRSHGYHYRRRPAA